MGSRISLLNITIKAFLFTLGGGPRLVIRVRQRHGLSIETEDLIVEQSMARTAVGYTRSFYYSPVAAV